MRKSVFLVALLALSGSALANENASILTGTKLREAVSGKTVYLMTPLGAEIPIRYRPNGTMQGSSSATLAALAGESVSKDTGRWWVVREQLCQQWNNWSDQRSHCYKLRTAGGAVQWRRNDGQTGTARIGN
jgi:hypothetical protein